MRADLTVEGVRRRQIPADVAFVARALQPVERRVGVSEAQLDLGERERGVVASRSLGHQIREYLLRLGPPPRHTQRVSEIGDGKRHVAHELTRSPQLLDRHLVATLREVDASELLNGDAEIRIPFESAL